VWLVDCKVEMGAKPEAPVPDAAIEPELPELEQAPED
jgi:hypothetical protein